jgi:hypothetical protein
LFSLSDLRATWHSCQTHRDDDGIFRSPDFTAGRCALASPLPGMDWCSCSGSDGTWLSAPEIDEARAGFSASLFCFVGIGRNSSRVQQQQRRDSRGLLHREHHRRIREHPAHFIRQRHGAVNRQSRRKEKPNSASFFLTTIRQCPAATPFPISINSLARARTTLITEESSRISCSTGATLCISLSSLFLACVCMRFNSSSSASF